MKISKTSWVIFTLLAIIAATIWLRFSFPQLSFINLSVDRTEALTIAEEFLSSQQKNITDYTSAVVFRIDDHANQYLQKNVGMDGLRDFIKTHSFDLFYWHIRFFKENQKEEYVLSVSSKTGEVLSFKHIIDENVAAAEISKEEARQKAEAFLNTFYGFDLNAYAFADELTKKHDNRRDYSFTWHKEGVTISWSDEETSTAKLSTAVKINGDQILSFSKQILDIPDGFTRFIKAQKDIGSNLMTVVSVINIIFIGIAVFYVTVKRNQLAMFTTKNFYIFITAFVFSLMLGSYLNQFQHILFQYQTSTPFNSFLGRSIINYVLSAVITSVLIIMPSLAGESLHYEMPDKREEGSFLHYLRSTFLTRSVTASIVLGYLVCIIMLGLQSTITRLGQQYCGVWVEYTWMNNLSTAYLPFLAAFILAFQAACSEELIYRFFAFNWIKKIGGSVVVAIIVTALVWGFSHSNYPVFPTWFRGVEVTILGLFLGFIYVRLGLITVLVAHYLFNAFWISAAYLFGTSTPLDFYACLGVCLLPLVFGLIAYIKNRPVNERPMIWKLNEHQTYNLDVLTYYLSVHWDEYKDRPHTEIVREIVAHGWDMAVVEEALAEIRKSK